MTTVLHLIDSRTPPAAAGLLELLRRHRPNDLVASVGSLEREDLPDPDPVIPRPWPLLRTAASRIGKLAHERGAAVIHCWTTELAGQASAAGLPMCVSVLAPPSAASLKDFVAPAKKAVFLAPSPYLRQVLLAAGVDDATIIVMPPAAEPVTKVARQAAQPRSRLVLIAPPQHDEDQGPYWAVWALGLIMHVDNVAELVIPGGGPAARRAEDLARANNMLDRVRLVDFSEVHQAWANADAAVLYDRAGIGLCGLAQAVAAGVPVIAAAAGELAEPLVHERTALLAPPAKALMLARAIWRLVQDRDLGPRLAQQARAELAHLTDVPAWLGAMVSLYGRLET